MVLCGKVQRKTTNRVADNVAPDEDEKQKERKSGQTYTILIAQRALSTTYLARTLASVRTRWFTAALETLYEKGAAPGAESGEPSADGTVTDPMDETANM